MKNVDEELSIARRVGEVMLQQDHAANAFGIELVDIGPGFAKMSMSVRKDMLNGFAICHGGVTFAFADTAFAYACNSRNKKTVALQCTINFTSAAAVGDVLTAIAEEKTLKGRTGIYDITITNQDGQTVAHFRGTSYQTSDLVDQALAL